MELFSGEFFYLVKESFWFFGEMLGKYLAPFFVLVVLLEVTEAMPQPQKGVESTTVKVLMPPSASASFDDEDDAVISKEIM